MSREIRRVTPNWQHPKDERGHYKPLHDNDYETASQEWEREYAKFMACSSEGRLKEYGCAHYWEYINAPDQELYRAEKWTPEEATAYQIYETVSDGTPVSPVFPDLDHLIQWLIDQGYSENAANEFAKIGWAPSMTFTPKTGFRMDIHAYDE
jgi:hypothetical protein